MRKLSTQLEQQHVLALLKGTERDGQTGQSKMEDLIELSPLSSQAVTQAVSELQINGVIYETKEGTLRLL